MVLRRRGPPEPPSAITVKLAGLSPAAREALERASNRSEYVRTALEAQASRTNLGTASYGQEVLERLEAAAARIEAGLRDLPDRPMPVDQAPAPAPAGDQAARITAAMAARWNDD